LYEPDITSIANETGAGIPYPTYGFGTHCAEVAVDTTTGKIDVLKLVSNYDVGKAIHPLNVVVQIEGGAVMGMGSALYEELIIENGVVQNCDLATYLIPTFLDVPHLYPHYVEVPDPSGPHGAKGLAEHTTAGPAAAIINAIYDAIGIRFYDIPVTPEKVLRAINRDIK
jgi:CO/xanthine dehydrogenase Mo-binding subunit